MKKLGILLFLAVFCVAQTPATMNYQGKLTDASGVAVSGPVNIVFRVFDVETGGTALWSETRSSIPVTNGLFDVILGEVTPLDIPFDRQYWIELQIGSETLSPREKLATVPYSFRTAIADSLSGGVPGDNWGSQVASTSARLSGDGTAGSPLDIAQQGASSGQTLKWNGTSWAPAADNNTTYSAGNGISLSGTTFSVAAGTGLTQDASGLSHTAHTGDATGASALTVVGIQGRSVTSTAPTSNQVLKWNGSAWAPADDEEGTGTVTSIVTNNGITGGPITTSGTIGLTGQALALHNLSSNGLIARTGSGTVAARTITAGSGISVTNGNGVSGNPTITNEGVTSLTAGTGISLSGGTGAVNISNSAPWTSSSGDYIQNQSASTQTGNFRINGHGYFYGDASSYIDIYATATDQNIVSTDQMILVSAEGIKLRGPYTQVQTATAVPYAHFDGVNQRLGIGTTTPLIPLDVYRSDPSDSYIQARSNDGRLRLHIGPTANYIQSSEASSANGRDLYFSTVGGVTTWMAIKGTTGNIGIGTTSPSTNLHIWGSSARSFALQSTNDDIDFYLRRGSGGAIARMRFQSGTTDEFLLSTVSSGTALSLRSADVTEPSLYVLKSNGNVGIGTTLPTAKLEVVANGESAGVIGKYDGNCFGGLGYTPGGYRAGVYGYSSGASGNQWGVYGIGYNTGSSNFAIRGVQATAMSTTANGYLYGVAADVNATQGYRRTAVSAVLHDGSYTSAAPGDAALFANADNTGGYAGYFQGGLVWIGDGGTALRADGDGDLFVKNDLEVTGGIQLNGSYITSWPSGGSPAGVNGNVQFNNSGAFGGSNNFHWDNTNTRLGIGTSTPVNARVDIIGPASGSINGLRVTGSPSGWSCIGAYNAGGHGIFVTNPTNSGVYITNTGDHGVEILTVGGDGIHVTGATGLAGYFGGDIRVTGRYYDTSGDAGTSGQILSSTVSGTNWIDAPTSSTPQWEDAGVYKRVVGNDYVRAYESGQAYGLYGRAASTTTSNYGVYGQAQGAPSGSSDYGVYGYISSGVSNDWAVYGYNSFQTGYLGGQVIGVGSTWSGAYGDAYGSSSQRGTLGDTRGYGVWGSQGTGTYAGYFEGNVNITGNLTVSGTFPGDNLGNHTATTNLNMGSYNIDGSGFYLAYGGSNVMRVWSTYLRPDVSGYDLGTSGNRWGTVYSQNFNLSGTLSANSSIGTAGQVLTSNGSSPAYWADLPSSGSLWTDAGNYLYPSGGIGTNLQAADVQTHTYGFYSNMNTGSAEGYGGYFKHTTSNSNSYGIYAEANFTGTGNPSYNFAGYFRSNSASRDNRGITVYAYQNGNGSAGYTNYGGQFYAYSYSNSVNYGVYSYAYRYSPGSGDTYGGYFNAGSSVAGATHYGIYATASGGTTNWAGYFSSGNVYVGNILGVGTTAPTYTVHSVTPTAGQMAVFGENTNGTRYYGYLGGSSYGVYGGYDAGTYGYLAGSSYAIYGYNYSGSYGYLGGYSYGAYARHYEGNHYAYIGTSGEGLDAWNTDAFVEFSDYRAIRGEISGSGNGTNYGYNHSRQGVQGRNDSGSYSFGTFGVANSASNRTGGAMGVLGAATSPTSWASLGYRNSGGTTYGAYFAGGTGSGSGRRRPEADDTRSYIGEKREGMGFGAYSSFMGGWLRGEVYGLHLRGPRYALYTDGDSYTNGVQGFVRQSSRGTKSVMYSSISNEVTINTCGMTELVDGTCRVVFDRDFSNLVSVAKPIIVTATPLGSSNGVYVTDITKDGFTIVENNEGRSNLSINWMATAIQEGYEEGVNVPDEILASDYDANMRGVMFDERNTEDSARPIHWDYSRLSFEPQPKSAEAIAFEAAFEKYLSDPASMTDQDWEDCNMSKDDWLRKVEHDKTSAPSDIHETLPQLPNNNMDMKPHLDLPKD
jgi:hypothetical protein